MSTEPEMVAAFKYWLIGNGGHFDPQIAFKPEKSGYLIVARKDLPPDTSVVSIPFSLAVTPEVSRGALSALLGADVPSPALEDWSERQLISSYLCMHWIADPSSFPSVLSHQQYLATLPSPEKLRTPLHFTPPELEAFKGTNLYGATHDRQRDWKAEWQKCWQVVAQANHEWGDAFTWERYLTASTYISSRAFPSTLLSPNPSLIQTPQSHPVLLPGIDALNHARSEPVSWVISYASPDTGSEPTISLVLHNSHKAGSELFNNYGPKPNAELILGYGFSLPHNPDDTIVLKIGASPDGGDAQSPAQVTSQRKWEVGRNAKGAEPVWEAVLAAVCEADDQSEDLTERTVEDELYAADMLAEMAESLYSRLPSGQREGGEIRPEVALMLEHYLEGQRDILQALIEFARNKERIAVEAAGLQIVDEDEDEDEE